LLRNQGCVLSENSVLTTVLQVLHGGSAAIALGAWGAAMYFWWVANNSLKPGVSRLRLLNPAAYLVAGNFSEAGLVARNRAILFLAVMVASALAAWTLRSLSSSP
jgi:hypothetical protein